MNLTKTFRMLTFLRRQFHRHRFNPTFPLGLLLNDYYWPKRSIQSFVKKESAFLSGDVLDVGCGSKPYAHLLQCSKYIGVDLASVDTGAFRKSAADFFYDGRHLPFSDESFNNLITTEVLEHVKEPNEFVAELRRVIKKDGHILLTTPFMWPEHGGPFDFQRFTSFGLDELLIKVGFEKVKQQKMLNGPEVILVMTISYLNDVIGKYFVKPRPTNQILSYLIFILMRPIVLVLNLGALISQILPRNNNMYFNIGVVYKKIR